jgi:hypothetical protein
VAEDNVLRMQIQEIIKLVEVQRKQLYDDEIRINFFSKVFESILGPEKLAALWDAHVAGTIGKINSGVMEGTLDINRYGA